MVQVQRVKKACGRALSASRDPWHSYPLVLLGVHMHTKCCFIFTESSLLTKIMSLLIGKASKEVQQL